MMPAAIPAPKSKVKVRKGNKFKDNVKKDTTFFETSALTKIYLETAMKIDSRKEIVAKAKKKVARPDYPTRAERESLLQRLARYLRRG